MSQSEFIAEVEEHVRDIGLDSIVIQSGGDRYRVESIRRLVRIVKRLREIGGRLAEDLRENDPGLMDWRAALEYDGRDGE